jgi:Flp pilus assembly protein TadD
MEAIKTSDYERALILFEMAFRRNPDDAKTANKLAVLYISHHDPEGAKPYAELAVKLDPSSEKYRGDLELVQRKLAAGEF